MSVDWVLKSRGFLGVPRGSAAGNVGKTACARVGACSFPRVFIVEPQENAVFSRCLAVETWAFCLFSCV